MPTSTTIVSMPTMLFFRPKNPVIDSRSAMRLLTDQQGNTVGNPEATAFVQEVQSIHLSVFCVDFKRIGPIYYSMQKSHVIRPLLFALLLMSCGEALAVAISCVKCGRYIREGEYVQADNKYYHKEHFVCARCGKPIGSGQYFSRDGQIYDRACFDDQFSLKCAWCGKSIEGEYRIRDGKNYHKSCYTANVAFKCDWCSEALLDSSIISEGKSYHTTCYTEHVALRCGLCGGVVSGEYLTTFRGGAWHSWHKESAPSCDFCAAFVDTGKPGAFVRYPDDRYLCEQCRKTAITDIDEVEALADSLAYILSGVDMRVTVDDLVFRLVDQTEMAQLGDRENRGQRGFTEFRQYSQMFGLFKEQHLTVSILNGMPRMECIKVLAHEMTHAWLFAAGRTKTEPLLCEGSCNYVALLALTQYPGAESEFLIEKMLMDTDPVYGEGLRRVKAWVEKVGIDTWVRYLQKNDKMPW
jgi:hypothetical protein